MNPFSLPVLLVLAVHGEPGRAEDAFGYPLQPGGSSQFRCSSRDSCDFFFRPRDGKAGTSKAFRVPDPADRISLDYSLIANESFLSARGGKLPGLCGDEEGSGPTKTGDNDELPGYSVRPMFYRNGDRQCLHAYVHPDRRTANGGDDSGKGVYYPARGKSRVCFGAGERVRLILRVELAAVPGQGRDCVSLQAALGDGSGEQAVIPRKCDFQLRRSLRVRNYRACLHVFAGGDASWAPDAGAVLTISGLRVGAARLPSAAK